MDKVNLVDDKMKISLILPNVLCSEEQIRKLFTLFRNAVNSFLKTDIIIEICPMQDNKSQLTHAFYVTYKAKGETDQVIRQVTLYLDSHYYEAISLVAVADRFHITPSYLSKLFKMTTTENFIDYLTRKRIEKASELLKLCDWKINVISESVGYENPRYFSAVFKKLTGLTPTEYRETLRES